MASKAKYRKSYTGKMHVRKGDTVMVMGGSAERGTTGVVLRTIPEKNQVVVEGVNVRQKSVKPNPARGESGGIVSKEMPIHASNVMLVDPETKEPVRVKRVRVEEGDKTVTYRVGKNGKQIPNPSVY